MDKLNHEKFAEQINTKFRIIESEKPLEIELVEVSEARNAGNQECFSLYFQSNKDEFLPQRLYNLEHHALGRGAIFLVPISSDDDNIKYEAVFNRLKQD